MDSYRFEKDWKQFYVAKKTDCADKDCVLNTDPRVMYENFSKFF